MHLVQSTIALSAPQNETRITLLISGEHAHLTEISHDMCRMAVERAIEPLHWEFVGKLAHRKDEARVDRGTGPWYDSTADFAAIRARYHLPFKWDALAEYRWLRTHVDGGTRTG